LLSHRRWHSCRALFRTFDIDLPKFEHASVDNLDANGKLRAVGHNLAMDKLAASYLVVQRA
jgi:hypothetical protein